MKAMILAAGLGNRMRPLTEHTPKPLLLVKGQPLIVHTIQALATSGIEHIVINVHHHAQKIMDYLGDGNKYGVKLLYSVEQELLDTGGGIKQALSLLGADPFLVVSADIYTEFNMAQLKSKAKQLAKDEQFTKDAQYSPIVQDHITKDAQDSSICQDHITKDEQLADNLIHLVMVDNPIFHAEGDYWLLQDKLALKAEKCVNGRLTYANIGVLSPKLFAKDMLIKAKVKSAKFPLRLLFEVAIEAKKATGEYYAGAWYNIGTPEILAAVTVNN